MALSNATIKNLAVAMTFDAINEIFLDERYHEMMMEIISEFVATNLQTEDYDLVAELSMSIMDNIEMVSRTSS